MNIIHCNKDKPVLNQVGVIYNKPSVRRASKYKEALNRAGKRRLERIGNRAICSRVRSIRFDDRFDTINLVGKGLFRVIDRMCRNYVSTEANIKYILDNHANKGDLTLIKSPTGTGKTVFAIKLAQYAKRCVFTVPNAVTAYQITKDTNEDAGGKEIAVCIVGKDNEVTKGELATMQDKYMKAMRSGKIIITTQSALRSIFDHSFTLIERMIDDEYLLIADEAHTIVADKGWRSPDCNGMYKIISYWRRSKCTVVALSGTINEYDRKVFEHFQVIDFTNKVVFDTVLNVTIVNTENSVQRKKAIFTTIVSKVRQSKSVLYRVMTIDEGIAMQEELEKVLGEGIYFLCAENKRTDRNAPLIDYINANNRLPDWCKVLITTKLLDTGLNINNKGVVYIAEDNSDLKAEELTQSMSRLRNCTEAYLFSYVKERNIYGSTLEKKRDNVRKFGDRLERVANYYVDDTQLYANERSIMLNELDVVYEQVNGKKIISPIAIAWAKNHKLHKFITLVEKVQIANEYKSNITLVCIDGPINNPPLTDEEQEFGDNIDTNMKQRTKIKKQQAFDFLDSLDRIDISSKESLANAMYEEGYVTEDCMKANDIMIIKEMLGNPYDKHNLNFILNNVTLFTDAGVKDLYEAIELSKKVNSSQHSDLVINIEQIRILSGLAYGREFKSTNGGLIKQISNAITNMCLELIAKGEALHPDDLDRYVTDYINRYIPYLDISIFEPIKNRIKTAVVFRTNRKVVWDTLPKLEGQKKGKTIKKFLYVSMKTIQEVYDTYVGLLSKLGVTEVRPLEDIIWPVSDAFDRLLSGIKKA